MFSFYSLTLTNEQAQAVYEDASRKDTCSHILWLAYVFDSDPNDDWRTGDNGWYVVKWEFDRIPGAADALRVALNPGQGYIHACKDEMALEHIQKLIQFYGRDKRVLRGNCYAISRVHPQCRTICMTPIQC